jgi:hypothetical protein
MAGYRLKQVLDLSGISLNGGAVPALDDDAIEAVAYFGDATGNGAYSSLDTSRVSRVAVGLDSGLSAYQLLDPVIVIDITGNGLISSLDTSRVSRAVVGLSVAEVPALPSPLPTIVVSGPDPRVSIPQDLVGRVGQTVTAPVNLLVTEVGGITIASGDVHLAYDASQLTPSNIRLGSVLAGAGFTLAVNATQSGQLFLSSVSSTGTGLLPAGSSGSLYLVDFTVRSDATSGATPLNLVSAALSDDAGEDLVMNPAPTSASDDAVDGLLTVLTAVGAPPSANTSPPIAGSEMGSLSLLLPTPLISGSAGAAIRGLPETPMSNDALRTAANLPSLAFLVFGESSTTHSFGFTPDFVPNRKDGAVDTPPDDSFNSLTSLPRIESLQSRLAFFSSLDDGCALS